MFARILLLAFTLSTVSACAPGHPGNAFFEGNGGGGGGY